jgi:hypothetical protein
MEKYYSFTNNKNEVNTFEQISNNNKLFFSLRESLMCFTRTFNWWFCWPTAIYFYQFNDW